MKVLKSILLSSVFASGALFFSELGAQTVNRDECRISIFFPNNISGLTSSQIAEIADFVEGTSGSAISVIGYASTVGGAEANVRLSQARASNVGAVVEQRGGNPAAEGRGEAGPGPESRRVDVVRDDCLAPRPAQEMGGLAPAFAATPLLLFLLNDENSINTTGTTR